MTEKIRQNYKNELNMRFICRIKFMKNSFLQSELTFIQILKVENIGLENTQKIKLDFNVLTLKTLLSD